MALICQPNPHDAGRMTRALIFEVRPGTRFAIDAETLHRRPELLEVFGPGLEMRLRLLDAAAYLVCLAGVLAALVTGWWMAGAGVIICVLMLCANRRTAGRLARAAARRSVDHFLRLHQMGCLWLVRS